MGDASSHLIDFVCRVRAIPCLNVDFNGGHHLHAKPVRHDDRETNQHMDSPIVPATCGVALSLIAS